MAGIGKKESEFPSYEEGTYEVKFLEWFPTDSEGIPYLIDQQRFGEETLVIRYRTAIGDEQGPPGSIDPLEELPLFVKAFGGDPTKLPKINLENVGHILAGAGKLMEGKATAHVNDKGWIDRVDGMTVPGGPALLRWGKVTTHNKGGQPSWVKFHEKWMPMVIGRLEIYSGPYKGAMVPFFLTYPLEVDEDTLQPMLTIRKDTGEFTKTSQRFRIFEETFGCPIGEFPIDKVNDIYNLVPEMVEVFDKKKAIASGYIDERGRADLDRLAPLPEGVTIEKEPEPVAEGAPAQVPLPAEEKPEPSKEVPVVGDLLKKGQVVLRQVVSQEVELKKAGAKAWVNEQEWKLTPAGKEWAKEILAPLCEANGVTKRFNEMEVGHIVFILDSLGYSNLARLLEGQPEDF